MKTVSVNLRQPIWINDIETSELQLRKPTGLDIFEYGLPFVYSKEQTSCVSINYEVVVDYIAELGSIPRPSVETITPDDLETVGAIVTTLLTNYSALLHDTLDAT